MPTYTYVCNDCGQRFDAMRRMSQRAEAPPCPTCASANTAFRISAPFVAGGVSSSGGGGSSCSSGFG